MMPVTITDSGTAKTRLLALEAGARMGLMSAGMFLVQRVKTVFQMYNPRGHASGNLIRSLSVSSPKLVNGWWRCRVGPNSTAPYGLFMHAGTGPAAGHGARRPPPTDAIIDWIKEKGIVPRGLLVTAYNRNTSGRFTGGYKIVRAKRIPKAQAERELKNMAFLIARKIGEKGTIPFPFLSAPFKLYKVEMEQIILSQIVRSLRSV